MNARLPIAFLALTLAFGCSKKKSSSHHSSANEKKKLAQYVLNQAPEIPNKVDTVWDGKLTLLGYGLDHPLPLKPGQKVKLTYYWRASAKLPSGYKLSTTIQDASGEKLLNIERNTPLRPSRKDHTHGLPLSTWQPGKVYVDQQTFHVPKAMTDSILVVTTVYGRKGRMPITKGQKDSSDRAIVASIPIAASGSGKAKTPAIPLLSLERLEPSDKITIDGKLDEPAWQSAPVLGPFVDVKTGMPPKSSPVGGKARMLWNPTNLYVAFEVTDADILDGFPKNAKDPHLWTKDTVELMVDPDGDGDNDDYYEIQIGPQNLVFDSQFDKYNEPKTEPDGPFGHEDWSSKLKSAVVVKGTLDKSDDKDEGYTVEAAIPWKSFSKAKKTPPALGDTWRMNLYAMKENSGVAWSPILGQGNFHKASRFGRVRFTAKGWTPPPETVDGGAPAPVASGAAPANSGADAAMKPTTPKAMASDLKTPTARPLDKTE